MRVAIVAGPHVPVPPKLYGGTELVIYTLIKGLKELGHEPILLGAGDSEVDCEVIPIVEKSIYFPLSKKDVPAFQKKVERINQKTAKLLRQLTSRVDIIHSHGFDLVDFQDFPNLTTIHGPILLTELPYYLERKHLYYVSISQNQQDAAPDLQYIGVVYNGLETSRFPVIERPEDYVCFLGRFDREKNPHLAIQLAINLGIKIKLAGKIDHLSEGYFDEEVKKYFNHPLVEYLGELGFKDKIKLLSKAKCNLHPTSFREPFGLTVLEAAYCGTPTLAIERGSMPELIEEGRTGMLVEDFVEGFHDIQKCFEMDRKYIANRAKLLFNYKTMTNQYLKAYKKALKIFKIQKEQEAKIRDLARKSRRDLDAIWLKSQKRRKTQTKLKLM